MSPIKRKILTILEDHDGSMLFSRVIMQINFSDVFNFHFHKRSPKVPSNQIIL